METFIRIILSDFFHGLYTDLEALNGELLHVPGEVEEPLDEVPVDEPLGGFGLDVRVEGAPERVLDLAHGLYRVRETLLELVQEVEQLLRQLNH